MNIAVERGLKFRGMPRKLTEEERQMLISVFHSVDEEHSGRLKRDDIKVAVVHLFGYKPSKYELDQMMQNIEDRSEADNKGYSVHVNRHTDQVNRPGITQEEFITMMLPKLIASDEEDDIRQTFLAFDSQCRGFIGLDDLKKAFSQVAPHMPMHSIESAFREVDRDGDGRVSFKDFEFMMKYSRDNGF